ncbi:MAG: hypothetical protein MUO54_15505 [Anaerolineales bacterium]|nr:hypothetical protein [Anaerolineales bacterium]
MLLSPGISTRKLINRVELYSPLDKKRSLRYGDIYLEEKKQWIFLPKGVSHLSAKEIQILKYLIKKKGANSLRFAENLISIKLLVGDYEIAVFAGLIEDEDAPVMGKMTTQHLL